MSLPPQPSARAAAASPADSDEVPIPRFSHPALLSCHGVAAVPPCAPTVFAISSPTVRLQPIIRPPPAWRLHPMPSLVFFTHICFFSSSDLHTRVCWIDHLKHPVTKSCTDDGTLVILPI
jgi:hypothetical protein